MVLGMNDELGWSCSSLGSEGAKGPRFFSMLLPAEGGPLGVAEGERHFENRARRILLGSVCRRSQYQIDQALYSLVISEVI
jgi:hypothetical protein